MGRGKERAIERRIKPTKRSENERIICGQFFVNSYFRQGQATLSKGIAITMSRVATTGWTPTRTGRPEKNGKHTHTHTHARARSTRISARNEQKCDATAKNSMIFKFATIYCCSTFDKSSVGLPSSDSRQHPLAHFFSDGFFPSPFCSSVCFIPRPCVCVRREHRSVCSRREPILSFAIRSFFFVFRISAGVCRSLFSSRIREFTAVAV